MEKIFKAPFDGYYWFEWKNVKEENVENFEFKEMTLKKDEIFTFPIDSVDLKGSMLW